MSLSGLAKFVVGFLAGIVLLLFGSAAAGLYVFSTLSAPPPKPVFTEERQQKKLANINTKSSTVVATNSKLVANTVASPSSPSPSPSQQPQLEPGAYKAVVKWQSGLSMRSEASFESSKVGGVAYNQEVVVIQDSDDKQWQKVRVVETNEEGWVKAGNLERAEPAQ